MKYYLIIAFSLLFNTTAFAGGCGPPLADQGIQDFGKIALEKMRLDVSDPSISVRGAFETFYRSLTLQIYESPGGDIAKQPYRDALKRADILELQACFPGLEALLATKRHQVAQLEQNANANAADQDARRAANRKKLKSNVEIETGFASDDIIEMQNTMADIGLSDDETNRVITNLAVKLDSLATYKESSFIYRQLLLSQGGVEFANRMIRLLSIDDKMGAVHELIKTGNKQQSRASKIMLSDLFSVPIVVFEKYVVREREAKGITPPPVYPSGEYVLSPDTNAFLRGILKK